MPAVEQQYSGEMLYERILLAMKKSGIDELTVRREDLSPVDEFHIRGAEITTTLALQAGLLSEMKILDAGCGIGGPARLLADVYGCQVTGIDLSKEYVRTATLLSALTGLSTSTRFIQGNALQLPFKNGQFDIAWSQHVQMNIADKRQFYKEIYRVLKPGGQFIYYDILKNNGLPLHFPVPWADNKAISWLVTDHELARLLHEAGFYFNSNANHTASGIHFLQNVLQRFSKEGVPEFGMKLLMGDSLQEKMSNLLLNLTEDKILLESGKWSKSL